MTLELQVDRNILAKALVLLMLSIIIKKFIHIFQKLLKNTFH